MWLVLCPVSTRGLFPLPHGGGLCPLAPGTGGFSTLESEVWLKLEAPGGQRTSSPRHTPGHGWAILGTGVPTSDNLAGFLQTMLRERVGGLALKPCVSAPSPPQRAFSPGPYNTVLPPAQSYRFLGGGSPGCEGRGWVGGELHACVCVCGGHGLQEAP